MKPGTRKILIEIFEDIKKEVGLRTDVDPRTHISPLAKKLIALSIAFGVITALLIMIDNNKLRAQLNFPDEAEKQYQAMRRTLFGPAYITDDNQTKCFDKQGQRILGPCPMLIPDDDNS